MKLLILSFIVLSFSAQAADISYNCRVSGQRGDSIKQIVVKVTDDPVTGMVEIPFQSGYPHRENLIAKFDITLLTTGDMVAGVQVMSTDNEEGARFYRTYSSAQYEAETKRIRLVTSNLTNLDVFLTFDCWKI